MSMRAEYIVESFFPYDYGTVAAELKTHNWPNRSKTIATMAIEDPAACAAMLRAIEAALRNGLAEFQLMKWRIELMNMRYRAAIEGWAGWQ